MLHKNVCNFFSKNKMAIRKSVLAVEPFVVVRGVFGVLLVSAVLLMLLLLCMMMVPVVEGVLVGSGVEIPGVDHVVAESALADRVQICSDAV